MSTEYSAAFKSHDAGGVLYVNTLAVKSDPSGPDIAEASDQAVADAIDSWLRPAYLGCLSPDYTLDSIEVAGILGHSGDAAVSEGFAGTLPLSGTSVHTYPKELCLVLTLKTATPGRSGRGRMFIPSPGYAEFGADRTSWKATGAFWGNVGAFGDDLLAGHDFTEDVLDYHLSARVWSRVDALTRDVTAYVRRPAFHWLRSRSTAP